MLRNNNRLHLLLALLLATVLFASAFSGPVASAQSGDAAARLTAATGGNVEITTSRATGTASFVRATNGNALPANTLSAATTAQANAFLAEYGELFGITNAGAELSVMDSSASRVRYQQVYNGVSVYGARLFAHFNRAGQLTAVSGRFVPGLNLSTTPSVAQANAEAAAIRAVRKGEAALNATEAQLVIYHSGLVQDRAATPRLAYYFTVTNGLDIRQFVFVDAQTGIVLAQFQGVHDELDRTVYDANNADDFDSATLCRDEGDPPSGDEDCDTVYEFTGHTYNYLFNAFGRDSFDGMGGEMLAYVHFGTEATFVNAQYLGDRTRYGENLAEDDVVAHEWGHGVTDFSADLIYQYQPGALNESFSDIIGETVDQLFGNGAADPWMIGEDVEAGDLAGGLRNMEDPNEFNQPATATDPIYLCDPQDNGGVHVNSGVPNKLYQLLVDGGTFNGETVTGIGLTKAGAIHYRALTEYLDVFSNFTDHGAALANSCSDLVGQPLTDPVTGAVSADVITEADCEQVTAAAAAVELTSPVCQDVANENPPPLCADGLTPTYHFSDTQEAESGWTVSDDGTFSTWTRTEMTPPMPEHGTVWYAANAGNLECNATPDASSASMLTSPAIVITGDEPTVTLNFEHYYSSEGIWDGGIVEYSVNGGAFEQLPADRFDVNGYNFVIASAIGNGNTNPIALPNTNRPGFTGFNRPGDYPEPGFLQSRADLTGFVTEGDTVQLRFSFGQDYCNGVDGWYVDTVQVYSCVAEPTSINLNGISTSADTGFNRMWLLAPSLMLVLGVGLAAQRRRR